MIEDPAPRALKVAEVARRLDVDARTVYAMIRRGELHGVKAGRVWRVPSESLEAFFHRQQIPTTVKPTVGTERDAEHAAHVRSIRGKYRDVLPSVDEFIARKQEEIALENRRWPEEAP
jgi:excisionase family DNA binding protein